MPFLKPVNVPSGSCEVMKRYDFFMSSFEGMMLTFSIFSGIWTLSFGDGLPSMM